MMDVGPPTGWMFHDLPASMLLTATCEVAWSCSPGYSCIFGNPSMVSILRTPSCALTAVSAMFRGYPLEPLLFYCTTLFSRLGRKCVCG